MRKCGAHAFAYISVQVAASHLRLRCLQLFRSHLYSWQNFLVHCDCNGLCCLESVRGGSLEEDKGLIVDCVAVHAFGTEQTKVDWNSC